MTKLLKWFPDLKNIMYNQKKHKEEQNTKILEGNLKKLIGNLPETR